MKTKITFLTLLLAFFCLSKNLNAQAPVLLKTAAGNSINIKNYSLAIGNTLFFTIRVGGTTDELWKTDGTPSGTVLVKGGFAGILNMVNINDTLFFVGMASSTSRALWKSDGSLAGTVLVKDFPGNFAQVSGFTTFNNTCYFNYKTSSAIFALWKTDGTDLGTILVKPGLELYAAGGVGGFYEAGSEIVFFANSAIPPNYKALWKTDGTAIGTSLIKDSIFNTSIGQNIIEYLNVGSLGFFTVNSGASFGLWRTDGTASGTSVLYTGQANHLTNLNGQLFFRNFVSFKHGLWKSDGTIAGTTAVSGVDNIGSDLASMGNSLYLGGKNSYDWELYKSDGTAAGTVLLKDINVGTTGCNLISFTKVNNTMTFIATDGVNGNQIWKTDGTPAGTVMAYAVADTLSSNEDLNFRTSLNNSLIFIHGGAGGDLYTLLVSSASGINSALTTKDVMIIYPNPSSGNVKIDWTGDKNAFLQVFNMMGEEVFQQQNVNDIDLSNQPKGIYLIKVSEANKVYTNKIIIK